MYLPKLFEETRLPVLHAAMQQAGLAMLVTTGAGGVDVSHLPLLLDPAEGPFGTLHGHMARANGQWRTASPDHAALAVFTGPDSDVSPSLYPGKAEHGKVVPTWNYVAIHARGRLQVFHDAAALHAVVSRLTRRHEDVRPAPWAVTDAPGRLHRPAIAGDRRLLAADRDAGGQVEAVAEPQSRRSRRGRRRACGERRCVGARGRRDGWAVDGREWPCRRSRGMVVA